MSNSSHCWRENTVYVQVLGRPQQRECWKKEMAAASPNRAEYVCSSERKKKTTDTNWVTVNHKLTVPQSRHPWSCTEQSESAELRSLRTCVKWLFCYESESSRCTVMASHCSVEFHPQEPVSRIELALSAVRSQLLPRPCEWCDMAAVLRSNNGLCLHRECFLWETEAHPRPHLCFHRQRPSQKLNFQVDGEGETTQKCQSRRSPPEEEIPCRACHVPWNERLYNEWWRREGGRGWDLEGELQMQKDVIKAW